MNRWTNRRFVYRWFQGASLSLAVSQSLLCLLSHSLGQSSHALAHLIGVTLFWTMILTICAGWYLAGGFLDAPTNELLDELLKRRGHPVTLRRTLEIRAAAIWLALLVGMPLVVTSAVALVRTHTLAGILLIARAFGLALGMTEVFALLVLATVQGLQGFALSRPRRLFAGLVLLPELLRSVDPSLPTLYTLAESAQALVARWSVWS